MFVDFIYELRARKVPVGAQEAVALARALAAGLHESSLEGLYHVARALCVHSETHLDDFDLAFSKYFRGIGVRGQESIATTWSWTSARSRSPCESSAPSTARAPTASSTSRRSSASSSSA
ncbi:MAG: hypothetical protein R3B70_42940 [Polyangiaceae bacterium]